MIHYIYQYTNKINGKKYIGQTNNLSRRKKQHIQDSIHCHQGHESSYNLPFHCAIRKYGIDNFYMASFNLILLNSQIKKKEINQNFFNNICKPLFENEKLLWKAIDTENWNEVNELESNYIIKYNTVTPNGYNLQARGYANSGQNKSKLSESTIQLIIKDLEEGKYIPDLAEKYQLSRSYLSDINNGRCLRQQNKKYPLQQNRITKDEYLQIIDLLENTNYSIRNIARYLNRSRDTIEKINKGYQKIIQALYDGEFPIRKDARKGYTLKPVETISGETESKIIIDT